MKRLLQHIFSAAALVCLSHAAAATPEFTGVKVCTKCHEAQGESWVKTGHAKAFESLKSGIKVEEKKKAKLDPAKDYTKDKDCVGCHSTGFGKAGGYSIGAPTGGEKALGSVGCETCHGPGGLYREDHKAAEKVLKATSKSTPRKQLVAQGENFDLEHACAVCHLNYQGSPYKAAKKPFTPYTPAVDAKYKFDFDKAVRSKSMHEHFKLTGVFSGDPVPAVRADLQKTAKELPDD